MKDSGIIIILFLSIQVNLTSQSSNPYTRDLVKFVEWFEGDFDNDSQLWYEARGDWTGSEEEKHNRLHVTHKKIELPALGENVFYVEEYIDDDPEQIIRQRLVSFESGRELGGILMSLYFLKDAPKYLLKDQSPDSFKAIASDDYFGVDGCDVLIKRQGDQFFGQMLDKQCQFGEDEKRRYSVHEFFLSESKYWRKDQSYLVATDEFYKGNPSEEPYKLRKAVNYKCNISFHEGGYYGSGENDKSYKDVIIHDQGGMKWVYNPARDKTYGLQLREKEYPFYAEGSDFFMLRFIEQGKERSEVIVTSEPHVSKISFSLGWSSASCYLEQ